MCVALLQSDRAAEVFAPESVGEPRTLLQRLHARERLPVFVGFDFPIGVPRAYARRLGVTGFKQLLCEIGSGEFSTFFDLAEKPQEISLTRPFYPRRPGGTCQQHLVAGLGVGSYEDLLRVCERGTATRGRACSLFWTLGGQQVGRAALAGWREVLQPACCGEVDCSLWPFDGSLGRLLNERPLVVAETYPAEAGIHLGIGAAGRGWSKRNPSDRAKLARPLINAASAGRIRLAPELLSQIEEGFGSSADGEDRFDALVGVLSMINVAAGRRSDGAPADQLIKSVEGWILGQAS
jgi:hypothetical protein